MTTTATATDTPITDVPIDRRMRAGVFFTADDSDPAMRTRSATCSDCDTCVLGTVEDAAGINEWADDHVDRCPNIVEAAHHEAHDEHVARKLADFLDRKRVHTVAAVGDLARDWASWATGLDRLIRAMPHQARVDYVDEFGKTRAVDLLLGDRTAPVAREHLAHALGVADGITAAHARAAQLVDHAYRDAAAKVLADHTSAQAG
ncbi:MAG TPA: hypothetical protein VM677_31910 [Actinokineospora sp.]|nr:hypothetical protein [Actinokineospora sp.]